VSARAGIVVTGTEVLTGRVQDRNGPWLADRLLELGIELAHISIVGDRRADMEAQLRFMADQGVDLVITSGGLGPTADDLTAEVVGGFQGREMVLDDALEQKIADILEPLMKRWRNLDFDAVREANRKQAVIPAGSFVIDPAGTAPGLVVPPADGREGPTVVVMPGPPRELHEMWPKAVESDEFGKATASRIEYEQRMLRLFGIPESEIAETLRVAEPTVEGFEQLEITTCLRRGELEVVVRHEPATRSAYDALEGVISERHGQYLYSTDGSTIDDQVSELLGDMQIAVGESCTGGLMAARCRGLLGRGQGAPPRRPLVADRGARRRLAGGRGSAGRRRDQPFRRPGRRGDHGHCGPRRRHEGQARGLRVLVREDGQRAKDRTRHPASGRPQ
jgi:nicotinamide-nucleotide amidase